MTSLRGPGEKNFNAISHKPTRAPIQFNSIQSVPVSFGLWDTALKFLSPGPCSDITDHLVPTRWSGFNCRHECHTYVSWLLSPVFPSSQKVQTLPNSNSNSTFKIVLQSSSMFHRYTNYTTYHKKIRYKYK